MQEETTSPIAVRYHSLVVTSVYQPSTFHCDRKNEFYSLALQNLTLTLLSNLPMLSFSLVKAFYTGLKSSWPKKTQAIDTRCQTIGTFAKFSCCALKLNKRCRSSILSAPHRNLKDHKGLWIIRGPLKNYVISKNNSRSEQARYFLSRLGFRLNKLDDQMNYPYQLKVRIWKYNGNISWNNQKIKVLNSTYIVWKPSYEKTVPEPSSK